MQDSARKFAAAIQISGRHSSAVTRVAANLFSLLTFASRGAAGRSPSTQGKRRRCEDRSEENEEIANERKRPHVLKADLYKLLI